MSDFKAIAKAGVLVEALPYIQKFRDSIFVVKYGGSFMHDTDPSIRYGTATDIACLAAVGIRVVVVHGGGKAITRAMAEEGLEPSFVDGLRVTDGAAIQVVTRTLNHEINPEICQLIESQGGRPLGIPGNGVFLCEKLKILGDGGDPVDLGYVGEIGVVKREIIEGALGEGYIPVISPIAQDTKGSPYNTNADVAASQVASALDARRLVYLCDVPGILADPKDEGSLISTLHLPEIEQLIGNGIIADGMLPKVNSAIEAIQNGVQRVHLVDGRMPHSILLEIFTDKGIGTEIVNG